MDAQGLLVRIAKLEEQVRQLQAAIESGPTGLTIRSPGAIRIEAASTLALSAGSSGSFRATHNLTLSTLSELSLGAAKNAVVDVGKVLTIRPGDRAAIQTGAATLDIRKSGDVSLSGKDIALKGTGKIDVKASKDLAVKGSKILQN